MFSRYRLAGYGTIFFVPGKIKPHPNRFVAVDSNSLIHRAFHAFPPNLTTSKGVQVNAVYGFTSMLLKVLDELKPKYLVCAFDTEKPTFRHTEYVEYKAQREAPDKTLVQQFPVVIEVLNAFNVPILMRDGFEADDILGTLAYWTDHGRWKSQGLEQVIVTGDKDLLQMVDENTRVWLPRGSFSNIEMMDTAAVKNLFGFGPEFVVDYKAMVGDNSDNIPGVKGIGDKTAKTLISQFGHLEEIYKNLDKVSERQKKLMIEGKVSAELSRKLATIVSDMDIDIKLEDCLLKDFDYQDVVKKFQELEFRSLLKKIPESLAASSTGVQMGIFDTSSGAEGEKLTGDDICELSEIDFDSKKVKKLAVCYLLEVNSIMIRAYYEKGKDEAFFCRGIDGKSAGDLVALFKGSKGEIVTYGWENLCVALFEAGIGWEEKRILRDISKKRIFDIALVSYFLVTGQRDYSLRTLVFSNASVVLPEVDLGEKKYCTMCLDAVEKTAEALEKKVKDHDKSIRFLEYPGKRPITAKVIKDVDLPLSLSLAEMTQQGIKVDTIRLERKNKELEGQIKKLEKQIYKSVGHEFNVSSTQQLGDVLFSELGLPPQKKTKTGFSTDESVLRKLQGAHPCVDSILSYREIVKLKSTYVEPLMNLAKLSPDHRVHSTFNQTVTSTGRLSSQDPNLQNIPTRSDLGKEIKSMFIAPEGKLLVSADYSQIELRIMAHFCRDKAMLEDFAGGKDFHMATAVRIFDKKPEDITLDERRIAKTINFGVIYGLSPFGLSEQLGIEQEDAAKYIEGYFERYFGIREYLDETVKFVQKNGYVESLFGRRRYVPGVKAGNRIARQASEREAINMPLQSTAADIMRIAMNRVYDWILDGHEDVGFLLQIHDEIVFECDKSKADKVGKTVKEIMEGVLDMVVPLVAEVGVGKHLGEVK